MCMCTTTTRSGQPYPLVWLNGGAHYRQVKGWLRPKLSALVLRQCLIMGSLSDNSPHTSAERVSLIVLFVSVIPPICPWVDVMSVVMFSSGTVYRHELDGPLLCLRLSDITQLEQERLSRAERKRQWEDEETRQTDAVRCSACLQLCDTARVVPLQQLEILQYSRVTAAVQIPLSATVKHLCIQRKLW